MCVCEQILQWSEFDQVYELSKPDSLVDSIKSIVDQNNSIVEEKNFVDLTEIFNQKFDYFY